MNPLLSGVLLIAALLAAPPATAQREPPPAGQEAALKAEAQRAATEQGADSDATRQARRALIRLYRSQHRPLDTLPYLQEELEAATRRHGPDSEEALAATIELSDALATAARPREALQQLEPALEAIRKRHGDGSPRAADALMILGRAYQGVGRFDDAIAAFEQAVRIRTRNFGPRSGRTAVAEYRLGGALWRVGRVGEAERLLRDAVSVLASRAGDESLQYSHALSELGELYRATGRLNEAEEAQQRALAAALNTGGPQHPVTLSVMDSLGATLREQRRYADAERVLTQARTAAIQAMGPESGRAVSLAIELARIYNASGRSDEAEAALREALAIRERRDGPDSLPAARVRVRLAEVLLKSRRHEAAIPELERALAVYQQKVPGDAANLATVRGFLGEAYLRSGRPEAARELLQSALADFSARKGAAHPFSIALQLDIAASFEKQGRLPEALAAYRRANQAALSFLERRATQSPEARAEQEQAVRQMLRGYLDLTVRASQSGTALGADPVAEGFAVSEALRSRSLQQAILRMGARAAVRDARLADLVRKEQDLRLTLGALDEGFIAGVATGQAAEERDLAKRLVGKRRQVEGELNALSAEIGERFPEYNRLMNPPPATVAEVQGALRADEALLGYLAQKERTLLYVVTGSGAALHVLPAGTAELERKVRQLRKSLDVDIGSLQELPAYDLALARELHALLLGPAAPALAAARHLIVVPHGPLLSLPFPALVAGGGVAPPLERIPFSEYRAVPFLATSHAVSVMPSATALVTLRKLARLAEVRQPFIGFGDPRFGGKSGAPGGLTSRKLRDAGGMAALMPLPETADELRAMARALDADPQASVILGERASEATVKATPLEQFRVVAFATHGLVAGDLDGLEEPALALSAPAQPGPEDDGLLTMGEVLGLKLNAQWVVLSACNTAAPDGSLKGEGLTGLAQAFFYAGSRALLVTLWAVESSSAQALTGALFAAARASPGIGRAQALAEAQRRMIREPGPVQGGRELHSYAHPFFWAAFELVGEGGPQ